MNATAIPLKRARNIAEKIRAELAPFCDRIEIAGSIRRGRPFVNDIDLVCLPKMAGQSCGSAQIRARIHRNCVIRSEGPQTIIADLPPTKGDSCIQLDLWLARPETKDLLHTTPTNYGTLLLCRTGSKAFNVWFANQARARDLHWNPHAGLFAGSALICSSREEDLFAALEIPFIPPEDRER